ncbi:metallophosphoesterase [Rhodoblastus sp. 17X3]|uniref:metallophosphoesterase n=1 Tax=Rhodoblastus sp. 17X3 TaxID=3047026 RepID=UPI0031450D4A
MVQESEELDVPGAPLREPGEPPAFMPPNEAKRCLDGRLGRLHARQRIGIETEHESQAFGQGLTFLHIENMPWSHAVIEMILRLTGTYWRGQANAARVELHENIVASHKVPPAFDGFAILHLSDMHVDMSERAMRRVGEIVADLPYDLCVMTGDYRGKTFGSSEACLRGMHQLRKALRGDVFAVLGNHDTILLVPDLERMGVRMLLNEHVAIERGGARIYLAGVDDAHFFRVDNLEAAADEIPPESFSILLSHTPEIYRQAAHAGFDLMLAGHTHGGQICLPGGAPITIDAHMPRRLARGAWRYGDMDGYTSVGAGASIVPVRFNCPPEVTLHRLRSLG